MSSLDNRTFLRHRGKQDYFLDPKKKGGKQIYSKYGPNEGEHQMTLLSVGGKLRSINERILPEEVEKNRSDNYASVELGKPVVIEYLRFSLSSRYLQDEKNHELMISTYLRSEATKKAAAEAISYYAENISLKGDKYELQHWGAKNYGHRLCFYTKSYAKESIQLTVQIMELDKVDKKWIEEIQQTIGSFGSIPIFTAYLPYIPVAKAAVGLIGKIINMLNRDDPVIPFHDLDLSDPGAKYLSPLQSGRYVCIPSSDDDEGKIKADYTLSDDHILVDRNGDEFSQSYFVIKVNSESRKNYENFDHFLGAADLLEKTNRSVNPQAILSSLVETAQAASDMDAAKQIEERRREIDDPKIKAEIEAYFKKMSTDMQDMYQGRYDTIMG